VHLGVTNPYLQIFEVCFRIGSIFFGNAMAVIPLLENEIVPRGWLTDQQFLQGLGLAQSMPGPTASLAAFIGAVYKGPAGGLVAEIGLLGPGFLLIFAVIPFWSKLRHTKWFQAILRGVNATAIGFIASACIVLFAKAVHTAADAMVFVIAAALTMYYDVSAPLALLVGIVAGSLFSEKLLNVGQLSLAS
jgi:chromate transporter